LKKKGEKKDKAEQNENNKENEDEDKIQKSIIFGPDVKS
jgi:hypothetical protein